MRFQQVYKRNQDPRVSVDRVWGRLSSGYVDTAELFLRHLTRLGWRNFLFFFSSLFVQFDFSEI